MGLAYRKDPENRLPAESFCLHSVYIVATFASECLGVQHAKFSKHPDEQVRSLPRGININV